MLDVRDLHTYYGTSYILQGIFMHVPKGSVVAVLGRNGVGKTTTLHSIISFVKPSRGTIMLEGLETTGRPTHEIMRLGVGFVPQGRRIFRSLTVLENLTIPFRCEPSAANNAQPLTRDEILESFPILKARRHQNGITLSGGEQQMLAIARALVSGPRLLLMDEPSEGLAPLIVREISGVISRLAGLGISVLLVEQNFNMALGVATKVYVMSRGTMVHECSPDDLRQDENTKAQYLGM